MNPCARPSARPLAPTRFLLLVVCLLCTGSSARAQDDPPAAPADGDAPPPTASAEPCGAAEHRQFDFWLGEWNVTNVQTGKSSAVNRIRSAHGGCVLVEEYENAAYTGMSVNFFDAEAGVWRQTWIDNQGQPLRLAGGLEDGSMVMRSEPAADGAVQRIAWTPRDDGTVRQHWESSKDGGDSWTTVFDGIYRRR